MKKWLWLGLLLGSASCSNDYGEYRGDGVYYHYDDGAYPYWQDRRGGHHEHHEGHGHGGEGGHHEGGGHGGGGHHGGGGGGHGGGGHH